MCLRFVLLLSLVLLFAACGGQGDANANVTPVIDAVTPENAPVVEPTSGVLIVTREPIVTPMEGALPVAAPGTLVASETEDPTAGMIFTSIRFLRVGGGTEEQPDPSVEVILNGDGTYTRNGVAGTLSQSRLMEINDAITAVNFFGLQGTMLGAGIEGSTLYRYALTIQRGDLNRTVSSMDGFMPQEYIALLGLIFEVGLRP